MASFVTKYEVQKRRTVTCKMGTAHAGAMLTADHFTGGQSVVDKLVKIGTLEAVPLTDAENKALAEFEESEKIRVEKEAEAKANSERLAAEAMENAELKKTAILEADFDGMKKDDLLKFAKDWEIDLKATLVEDMKDEFEVLQASMAE